jgi:hypothetical protein
MADFRDACLVRQCSGQTDQFQVETPRRSTRPSFYFDTNHDSLRWCCREQHEEKAPVEHIDPAICEVEFRLLCIMSAISLAISGTVIFLLV